MWTINHKRGHVFPEHVLLLFLGLLSVVVQGSWAGHVTYQDDDTLVVEDRETKVLEGTRWTYARQFPGFGQGWPLGNLGGGFPQLPQLPSLLPSPGIQKPGQCMTRNGYQGECRQMKQCFPSLFTNFGYTADERGEDLHEFYQASSCGVPVLSNHLYYAADPELRQSMVCCKKPVSWPGSISQFPATTKPPYVFTRPPQNIKRNQTTNPQRPIIGGPWGHRPPTQRPPTRPTMATVPTTTTRRTTARTTPPFWQQSTTTTRPPWQWQTTPAPKPPTEAPAGSCGVSRIVGGSPAVRGTYPWLVSIQWGGRHDCGGSLIDNKHILTAAHCADKYRRDVNQVTVLLGATNRGVQEEGRILRRVKRIMIHSGFINMHPIQNDIAMLTLDSPVDISARSPYLKPICLPSNNMNYDSGSTYGWVAGWGGTAQNRPPVNSLLHVKLRVITNQDCASQYQRLGHRGITPGVFCAGNPGQDACQGDSGGPFIIRNGGETGPATQIGIVSWGIGCGVGPGVYTRVDKFMPWIKKNMAIR